MKTLNWINLLVAFALFLGCEKSLETNELTHGQQEHTLLFYSDEIQPNEKPAMKAVELNSYLKGMYIENNDFSWGNVDNYTLWSAVMNSGEKLVAIGYKPTHVEKEIGDFIHEIDVQKAEWKSVREALLKFIVDELNKNNPERPIKQEDIIDEIDGTLPLFVVKLSDYEVIAKLRQCENVRYVEPLDYDELALERRSSAFGCGGSGGVSSADYTSIFPNVKMPWNYSNMKINQAWSYSKGNGITVGVIDAGFSSSQYALNAGFSSGQSTGRFKSFSHTYGSSAYNSCVHGTSMAGIIAAPRNSSGNMVGVAYKSNLVGIRACQDVMLNKSSERKAVKNAMKALGNNSSVRIMSMSIGWIFGSSYLKDGTNYAYGKGKLIFAAGGTSLGITSWWGVIYPARYSKIAAVTGVKENNDKCGNCHWGSQIEFTVMMQRNASSSRLTLALGVSGNSPIYMGGSSSATATAAGIAALVWSANPSLSRDQVRSVMRQTAQYYPGKNSKRGYGLLDAKDAVQKAIALL